MKGERALRLCRQRKSAEQQARHRAASLSPTDVRTTPTRPAELAMPGGKPRRAMPANPVPLALPPPPTACSLAAFACGDNLLSGLPITRYSGALILWCRR